MVVFDPCGFHTATVPVDRERLTVTITFVRASNLAGGERPYSTI